MLKNDHFLPVFNLFLMVKQVFFIAFALGMWHKARVILIDYFITTLYRSRAFLGKFGINPNSPEKQIT